MLSNYNARKVYRHSSDKGSVIEFDMYGKAMKMFVVDAAYRPYPKEWGCSDGYIPSVWGGHYMAGEWLDPHKPLPKVLEDSELQNSFPEFEILYTAKDFTDLCIEVKSIEPANACRNVDIGLGPMDLPNVYELMVIFQEADRLDALDPTFESNKAKGLGYKSEKGRFYNAYWSSSPLSKCAPIVVTLSGYVGLYDDYDGFGVIPILEL